MSNDPSNTNILETRGLAKEVKGLAVVRDVNLQVRQGSIHALIGPNGAGKTTVFNLRPRFLQPNQGTTLFNGIDIAREEPAQIARRGVIRSFQISATFGHMTALVNVRLCLQRKLGSPVQFWRHERSLHQLNERAMALLEEVDLARYAWTLAVEMPCGRKRVLEITITLAPDPQLMPVDEPTQGLGHEDVDRVAELICKVAAKRTVLMVEHNLSVVTKRCDTITVLQRGHIPDRSDPHAAARGAPRRHEPGRALRIVPQPQRAPRLRRHTPERRRAAGAGDGPHPANQRPAVAA